MALAPVEKKNVFMLEIFKPETMATRRISCELETEIKTLVLNPFKKQFTLNLGCANVLTDGIQRDVKYDGAAADGWSGLLSHHHHRKKKIYCEIC